MAGDWIKMRCDLEDDPAVIGIAADTGLDEFAVVGRLHNLWSWANKETTDGNARSVTESWIDRRMKVTGFARSMQKHGWLDISEHGIKIPNFERHNGKSAKKRALTANRVRAKRNADSVTEALPEKRREENKEQSAAQIVAPSGKAASEPPQSAEDDPAVLTFPTVGTGAREWLLRQSKVVEYEQAFPAVNVVQEIRNALQWCRDNPAKRKTHRGMPAFLTRWLTKAQDRGGNHANGQQVPSGRSGGSVGSASRVGLSDESREAIEAKTHKINTAAPHARAAEAQRGQGQGVPVASR